MSREVVLEAIELATCALIEPYEPYHDLGELDRPPAENLLNDVYQRSRLL